ncbi:MAG TPA: Tad domain-containing protein [Gemmatimonadota bacterium]|nr:Tad domain-containing protein [Gemmatimonadota bacterium]
MKDLARQMTQAIRGRCSDERGVALIVAAGSMIALTSAVALAVDVGMLTVARTQAQTAADGAAMAGAAMLIKSPDNSGLARVRAIEYAGFNAIQGDGALVQDEDVVVDLGARTVGVQVLRTEERGNPMGTFFARIFGVSSVDITAWAKAKASNAGGVNCLLPLAIPDKWSEAGGPGNPPKEFNPELGDVYVPWMDVSTDPPTYNDDGTATGYSESDIGQEIVLTSNKPGDNYTEEWYYAWRPEGEQGAEDFEENIQGCVDPSSTYYLGLTVVLSESGNQVGKTRSGFENLINSDPGATWNESMSCVVDSGYELSDNPAYCRDSSRIRPIPMFDPTDGPDNGAKPFRFSNFSGVFIDRVEGQKVIAHWVGYQGVKPASPEGGTRAGSLLKVVQLIE